MLLISMPLVNYCSTTDRNRFRKDYESFLAEKMPNYTILISLELKREAEEAWLLLGVEMLGRVSLNGIFFLSFGLVTWNPFVRLK